MGLLAGKLAKSGHADPKKVLEVELEESRRLEKQRVKDLKEVGLNSDSAIALEGTSTIAEFKHLAKNLLLKNSSLMKPVIDQAQRMQELDGGRKLIFLCLQLRDNLAKAKSAEEKQQLINRTFRKSNGTHELSEE